MKDLKCGKKNCTYNKGYCCCAKKIEISGKTDCMTYSPDLNKKSMFEAGSDFEPASYSVDTKVGCSADCLFQKDNRCVANGITVMSGEHKDAACLTYVKR